MKWVKCKERMPKMETPLFLKLDGEIMAMGNFYEQDQCYMVYVQPNGAHEEYDKLYSSPINGNIEWLDESDSPTQQEGEDEMWDEVSEASFTGISKDWLAYLKKTFSIQRK